ncbi:MAG: hypothetical protein ISQ02_00110 [Pseudomonadales bacterium]|nr:hypothetical protein [Pseudomonadales bacterium]
MLLCLEGPGSALLARCLSLGDGKAPAADYWPAPCRGHPLLPAPNTPFADLGSLQAALIRQWSNEALRATAEDRTLVVAEGLGAVAALARRLEPAASPARLGALLLALLDGASGEGAVDFLWLSAGPGKGEPAVSHAFADAQHPRLLLNAGKLSPAELWEEAQAHCRLGPAALSPALGSAPAPLAPKHFAGGYALSPEGAETTLPYPRHRLTGPALAKDGEPMVLGPEGILWGLTRRLSLHPLSPQPGLAQGAGYLLQEDGLAFGDHRAELPAFLAEDSPEA